MQHKELTSIDFLLSPSMLQVSEEQLGKNRIYIVAQIAIFVGLFFSALMYQLGYSLNNTHLFINWAGCFSQLLLVLSHRHIKHLIYGTLITVIINSFTFSANAFFSGGIYSNDLFFLQQIFVAVILISHKTLGVYIAIVEIIIVCSFFAMELLHIRPFQHEDDLVPADADFFNTLIFMLVSLTMTYLFANGHDKLKKKLKRLQLQQVNELNRQVKLQTDLIEKRNLELEKLRKDIAMDFHDEVGNQLASLNALAGLAKFETTYNKASNPDKIIEILGKVEKTTKTIHQQSRDFLWSIGSTSDKVSEIFSYIRDFAVEQFEEQSIEIEICSNGIDNSNYILAPRSSRHLILILKESIINCKRHSQATKSLLKFTISDTHLTISLQDNGCGFPVKVLSQNNFMSKGASGHGLQGMKSRADEINANLTLSNLETSGAYTQLEVNLG